MRRISTDYKSSAAAARIPYTVVHNSSVAAGRYPMPLSFLGHVKEDGVSLMKILLPIVHLWLPRWLTLLVLLPWVWALL